MIKPLLLIAASLFLAQAAVLSGTEQSCVGGKMHTLQYQATPLKGSVFVDLDTMTDKLKGVTCDIDHTKLTLSFKSVFTAAEWYLKFHDWNNHFMMGGQHWNCSSMVSSAGSMPTNILRRVVGASKDGHDIIVSTAEARYDQVFEDASIGYGIQAHSSCQVDKHVCLGYNTDCSGAATSGIPLYSGKFITASCSDCFAALEADVFVNISIRKFSLQSVSAGFQNVNLQTGVVLDAQTHGQTSASFQKTLPIVVNDNIISFKIGPVPVMLWFDAQADVAAEAAVTAQAELAVGATGKIDMGDATVSWDPVNHWQHSSLKFSPSLTPQLTTSASMDATATLGVSPSFSLNMDRMFTYSMKATPKLDAEVTASKAAGQVCLTSTYAMDVTATSELKIDIPIIGFEKDWTWGPKTVASFAGQAIPKKCVSMPQALVTSL